MRKQMPSGVSDRGKQPAASKGVVNLPFPEQSSDDDPVRNINRIAQTWENRSDVRAQGYTIKANEHFDYGAQTPPQRASSLSRDTPTRGGFQDNVCEYSDLLGLPELTRRCRDETGMQNMADAWSRIAVRAHGFHNAAMVQRVVVQVAMVLSLWTKACIAAKSVRQKSIGVQTPKKLMGGKAGRCTARTAEVVVQVDRVCIDLYISLEEEKDNDKVDSDFTTGVRDAGQQVAASPQGEATDTDCKCASPQGKVLREQCDSAVESERRLAVAGMNEQNCVCGYGARDITTTAADPPKGGPADIEFEPAMSQGEALDGHGSPFRIHILSALTSRLPGWLTDDRGLNKQLAATKWTALMRAILWRSTGMVL